MAKGWRWMLAAAAAYNFMVGVPGLLLGAGVPDKVIALFVTCFGLIYVMVAAAPQRLAPVLWAGVAGKIGVVALMLPEVLASRSAAGTGTILAGDALFTLAFIAFLLGPARKAGGA